MMMTDDTVVGDLSEKELDLFEAQRILKEDRSFMMKKQKGMWNLLHRPVFRGFWIDPKEATLESWGLEEGDERAFLAMAVQESEKMPKPKSECCRWLDIDGSDGDKDIEWIEKLNLSGLTVDELSRPLAKWNSHVVGMRSTVLLKLRILPAGMLEGEMEKGSENSNPDHYLAAVISQKLLITWSTFVAGPNQKYRSLSQQLFALLTIDNDESPLHDASTSSALLAYMDFHLGRTSQYMLDLRSASTNLMKRLDDDPSLVNISEIMNFKMKLLLALAVAEDQAQCVTMMKKLDRDKDFSTGMDFSKLKGALSFLIAAAEATERSVLSWLMFVIFPHC
jgi:hypothetical protein